MVDSDMKPGETNINIGIYERQAELYDAIYEAQGKDYQKEATQIHQVIEKSKLSRGNKLLDVGCGTGGHFPFLSKWYTVEGLDLDGHMLAVARKRFPNISFHQGDMVNFSLDNQFDAVTCLFSAIGYTKTVDRMQAAIVNMTRHVKPGGVLVVEPWFSPDQWNVGRPSATFVDKPDLKVARVNISEREGDVSAVNFHFVVAKPGKAEYFTELHELGLFTPEQYLQGFEMAGLRVEHDPKGVTGRGLYIGVKGS